MDKALTEESSERKNHAYGVVVPWQQTLPDSEDPIEEVEVGERGISCHQFMDLAKFVKRLCQMGLLRYSKDNRDEKKRGKRIPWDDMTMFEVCYDVVKPVLKFFKKECSWSTFINGKQSSQKPKTFISHSWTQEFRNFVAVFDHLMRDRGLTASDNVWICTFANNQFKLNLGDSLYESPFHCALEYSEEVALFLDHNASSLGRSWCNFELSITLDTEQTRKLWETRKEIADKHKKDIFEIEWEEVESKVGNESVEPKWSLFLITPAGMVGTARVTSGTVLNALQTFKSDSATASNSNDQRRIKNHIAYNFLQELDDESKKKNELKIKNGKNHIEYEQWLRGAKADKFKMFDETIFLACNKELQRHKLFSPTRKKRKICSSAASKSSSKNTNVFPLSRRNELKYHERSLTLSQLRDLQNLLHGLFLNNRNEIKEIFNNECLKWKDCTSHHLYPLKKGQKKGLRDIFMPPGGATYAECVNEGPQKPNFHVVVPYKIPLFEVFQAIEWHAEALELPDRTSYFIHSFCLLNDGAFGTDTICAKTVMEEVTGGLLLVVNNDITQEWKEGKMSLWCAYEVSLAKSYGFRWDIACGTGVIATDRQFSHKKWARGTFDPIIAANLTSVTVKCGEAYCLKDNDREMLLESIRKGEGEDAFDKRMTTTLNAPMLLPMMQHAAFVDDGMKSIEILNEGIHKLQYYKSKKYINPKTLLRRGSYGETPLHIMTSCCDDLDRTTTLGKACHKAMITLMGIGFDVNAQDDEGDTPLHWAVFAGNVQTTQFLLRNDASPMITNDQGASPLDFAKDNPTAFLHPNRKNNRVLVSVLKQAQLDCQSCTKLEE